MTSVSPGARFCIAVRKSSPGPISITVAPAIPEHARYATEDIAMRRIIVFPSIGESPQCCREPVITCERRVTGRAAAEIGDDRRRGFLRGEHAGKAIRVGYDEIRVDMRSRLRERFTPRF